MRIAIVISSLEVGGAERVASLLAEHWATRHDVTLLTLAASDDGYQLGETVRRITLDVERPSKNVAERVVANVRRIMVLRRALRELRPNAVVSFTNRTNVLTLLASGAPRPIISERIDPREHPIGAAWSLLRRITYPTASALVVQTGDVQRWGRGAVGLRRTHVIPNPVQPPALVTPEPVRAERVVLAMGRLVQQKGFDLLIDAFAACARSRPEWRLVILGEGEQRPELQAAAERHGIVGRVSLPGKTAPARFLATADIFVLSSRYEGFPNALLEAMAAGIATISFDCRSGPREIIRNGVDGILVPPGDTDALAAQLAMLMDHDETRRVLATRAPGVVDRFSLDRVMAMWDDLLESLAGSQRD